MSFPKNLQFLRARAGTTQEQLAEELGVSRQSVSKWESGTSFPEMETLLRLCDLYNTDLDTLLRGSVEQSLVGDTARYDQTMNRFSLQVACSVGAILAAVGGMIFLLAAGVPELLTVAFLLLVITVSAVVLVASGIQQDAFRKRHPTLADFYTQEEKDTFQRTFVWLMAGGVGAILFGVVLLVLFLSLFQDLYHYQVLAYGGFLLIVAGAVTGFVYGGIQNEKYKIWKYNRDNNPTPEVKKRQGLIGALCGGLMVLATAVYVGLGLALELWDKAWWVFAVGGILCGVVSILLDPYKGEDG